MKYSRFVEVLAIMQFETDVLAKGGVVCIFGCVDRGIQYGNLLNDYLLAKAIENERFEAIFLCINDRNPHCFPSSSKTRPILPENLLNLCEKSDIETEKSILFLSSLSEILLLHKNRNIALLFSAFRSRFLTSICVVHSSLHDNIKLTELKLKSDTSLLVSPNDGSMSAAIAVEIHSIRKSKVTGKVVERKDLFSLRTGDESSSGRPALVPIKGNTSRQTREDEEKEEIQNGEAENENMITLSAKKKGAYESRLITFDSNDPEFDDDSDPDHDLDL